MRFGQQSFFDKPLGALTDKALDVGLLKSDRLLRSGKRDACCEFLQRFTQHRGQFRPLLREVLHYVVCYLDISSNAARLDLLIQLLNLLAETAKRLVDLPLNLINLRRLGEQLLIVGLGDLRVFRFNRFRFIGFFVLLRRRRPRLRYGLIAESPIECRIGCIRLFLLLDNFLIDFIAHSRTPQKQKPPEGGSTQRRQRGNAVGVPLPSLRAALLHLDWIYTNQEQCLDLGNPATNRGCLDRIEGFVIVHQPKPLKPGFKMRLDRQPYRAELFSLGNVHCSKAWPGNARPAGSVGGVATCPPSSIDSSFCIFSFIAESARSALICSSVISRLLA